MFLISKENKKGFLLLEVLIAAAILLIVMGGLFGVGYYSFKLSAFSKQASIAANLAQESMEAFRNFRDGTDWAEGAGIISAGSDFYMEKSLLGWTIVSGNENIGIFTRKIIMENVSRNPETGEIESDYNPSRDDADTKKVIAVVEWGQEKQVEITAFFTNWK
ncbi:MAG: prepilin-type N-terminal cleavage/methylation domain-containing protein [bacterium]|nr:prepilin-type N-terminal cleavage/methylation domain-containing protein [bacterium]